MDETVTRIHNKQSSQAARLYLHCGRFVLKGFILLLFSLQAMAGTMVDEVLVMRSPGELLVSQLDFLGKQDIFPYSPVLGGSWSQYDLDIKVGNPIEFSATPGMYISEATSSTTKIFSVLLGKFFKYRYLIVVTSNLMTILDVLQNQDIGYKIKPSTVLPTDCSGDKCRFDSGSFNFITIANRVVFVCDVVAGDRTNGTVWLATWSIELELPFKGQISSASLKLEQSLSATICNSTRNFILSRSIPNVEDYIVMRYCYNQTAKLSTDASEIEIIHISQLAYDPISRFVMRDITPLKSKKLFLFDKRPTPTQFQLVQIVVVQQVAVFIMRDSVAFQRLDRLRDELLHNTDMLKLNIASLNDTDEWREMRCNYMGPITGCGIVGNPNVYFGGIKALFKFIEFSVYEDQLVKMVTYTKELGFASNNYVDSLQFVGFRRTLLVLAGPNGVYLNKFSGFYKIFNFTEVSITKMVDFYFEEGLGSFLEGYLVVGLKNLTNGQEMFKLVRVTLPYFHLKSYVDLSNSTCDRYLSNCAQLDIEFEGLEELKDNKTPSVLIKRIYLIDSQFSSVLPRSTNSHASQISAQSDYTDLNFSKIYYGVVIEPQLSLDQAQFQMKKGIQLTKHPNNTIGSLVEKTSYTLTLKKIYSQGDIIEHILPHALTMKYQPDGWMKFTLVVRFYKKPPGGSRVQSFRLVSVNIPPENRGGLGIPGSRVSWIELDHFLAAHNMSSSQTAIYPVQLADYGTDASSTLLAVSTAVTFAEDVVVGARTLTFFLISIIPESGASRQVLTSQTVEINLPKKDEPIKNLQVYSRGASGLLVYLQDREIYSLEFTPGKGGLLYHSEYPQNLSLANFFNKDSNVSLAATDIIDFNLFEGFLIVVFRGRLFGKGQDVVGLFNVYRSRSSGSPAGAIYLEEPVYHIYFHPESCKVVILYPETQRICEYSLDQDLLSPARGSKFEPLTTISVFELSKSQELRNLISSLDKIPTFVSRQKSFHHDTSITVATSPYIVLQSAVVDVQNLEVDKLFLIFQVGSTHSLLLAKIESGPYSNQRLNFTFMPFSYASDLTDRMTLVNLHGNGEQAELTIFQPSSVVRAEYTELFADETFNQTNLEYSLSDLSLRQFGDKLVVNRSQKFSIFEPTNLSSKNNSMVLQTDTLGMVSDVELGCAGEEQDGIYSSREPSSLSCKTSSGVRYDLEVKHALHLEASLRIDIHKEKITTELIPVKFSTRETDRLLFLTNTDDQIIMFESIHDKLEYRVVASLNRTKADFDFPLRRCPKIATTYECKPRHTLVIIFLCDTEGSKHVVAASLSLSHIELALRTNGTHLTFLQPENKITVAESIWDAMVVREEFDVLLDKIFFLRSKITLAGHSTKYIIKVYAFDDMEITQARQLQLVGTSFNDKYDLGDIHNFCIFEGSHKAEKAYDYRGYLAKFKHNPEKQYIEVNLGSVQYRSSDSRFEFLQPQRVLIRTKGRRLIWGEIQWASSNHMFSDETGQLLVYMLFDDFLEEWRVTVQKNADGLRLRFSYLNGKYKYNGICSTVGYFRVRVLENFLTLDCVPFDAEGSTNNLIIFKRPKLQGNSSFPENSCINATHVFSQDIGYDSRNMENLLFKSKTGTLRLLRLSPHRVINQYKIYDGLEIKLTQKKRSFFQNKQVYLRLRNHFCSRNFVLNFNSEPLADQLSDMITAKKAPIYVGMGWVIIVVTPFLLKYLKKAYRIIKLKRAKFAEWSYREIFADNWDRHTDEILQETNQKGLLRQETEQDFDESGDTELARDTVHSVQAIRGTKMPRKSERLAPKTKTTISFKKQEFLLKRVATDLVV